jgi:hypothetical protein
MSSGVARGWAPVRVKKTRRIKNSHLPTELKKPGLAPGFLFATSLPLLARAMGM